MTIFCTNFGKIIEGKRDKNVMELLMHVEYFRFQKERE